MSTVAEAACPKFENPTAALAELVSRATALYTLPTVAAEVLELTSNPKVDVRALKECILRDPALTAKLLRVVNSSLFGLSRQVSDLNQALALLGIKPLKILVLGFSLPENLFQGLSLAQLEWYWSQSLTRAVAAREISEQLLHQPGDESFLAGLLQDLGILVLVRQLGDSYTSLLTQVIEQDFDLKELEIAALGFDHQALTAALLDHWNMPPALVDAVAGLPENQGTPAGTAAPSHLSRVIHLANLLAELVGQKKLGVLPELLATGDKLCQLDGVRLRELLATLQPKVEQLAAVLAVDLREAGDYLAVLAEAHEQIAVLTENVLSSVDIAPPESAALEVILQADVARLRTAMQDFVQTPAASIAVQPRLSAIGPRPEPTAGYRKQAAPVRCGDEFVRRLAWAVGVSRSRRQSLSLVLVEFVPVVADEAEALCEQILEGACQRIVRPAEVETSGNLQRMITLADCDWQEAVRIGHQLIDLVEQARARLRKWGPKVRGTVAIGVSSVTIPPRNFQPDSLVQAAQRCLSAAKLSETSAVKSLEVY